MNREFCNSRIKIQGGWERDVAGRDRRKKKKSGTLVEGGGSDRGWKRGVETGVIRKFGCIVTCVKFMQKNKTRISYAI